MKFVLQYMKKNKLIYCIALLAMFCSIALDMVNPLITRGLIDDVIKGGRTELLMKLLAGLFIVTFGRAIFGYLREYLFDKASIDVAVRMRKDIYTHLNTLSLSFFDKQNTGELMARLKEDVDNIYNITGFCLMLLIEQVFYTVLPLAILFSLSIPLTLLYLVFMPVILFLALRLEKKLNTVFEKISDQAARMNTTAQENITGVRLVRSFAKEKHESKKFSRENEKNYQLNYEQTHIWSVFHPKIELLSNVMTIVVITIGGILVIGDDLTIGTLVAVNSYGMMLTWPMKELGWLMNMVAQASASIKKLKKIMSQETDIKEPENPVSIERAQGRITFENVCFQRESQTILDNVSFDVAAGSTTAIMGATGSGKSSIANLMGRYYECTSGVIKMDGEDIRKWSTDTLRKNIACVSQDVFLFSDTVMENVCFGNNTDLTPASQLPKDKIIRACQDAQAYHFISELPEGFETIIGERGIGLSGGQKQRLSIARAFLKDAPVLILDDATSALDMETEHEIQKAVEAHTDITKIIIAHRISAVKDADEIIVLDHGRIIERGNHHTLMALKGYYYETYYEQYKQTGSIKTGGELHAY